MYLSPQPRGLPRSPTVLAARWQESPHSPLPPGPASQAQPQATPATPCNPRLRFRVCPQACTVSGCVVAVPPTPSCGNVARAARPAPPVPSQATPCWHLPWSTRCGATFSPFVISPARQPPTACPTLETIANFHLWDWVLCEPSSPDSEDGFTGPSSRALRAAGPTPTGGRAGWRRGEGPVLPSWI